jgi:hypothetical protein
LTDGCEKKDFFFKKDFYFEKKDLKKKISTFLSILLAWRALDILL